jgi:hypothetical protein
VKVAHLDTRIGADGLTDEAHALVEAEQRLLGRVGGDRDDQPVHEL